MRKMYSMEQARITYDITVKILRDAPRPIQRVKVFVYEDWSIAYRDTCVVIIRSLGQDYQWYFTFEDKLRDENKMKETLVRRIYQGDIR